MKTWAGLFLIVTGLSWATWVAAAGLLSGNVWLVFPLVGIVILDVLGFRLFVWTLKHVEILKQVCNIAVNIIDLLQNTDQESAEKLLEILSLPPDQFRARGGL
jgi:hypothetical protein